MNRLVSSGIYSNTDFTVMQHKLIRGGTARCLLGLPTQFLQLAVQSAVGAFNYNISLICIGFTVLEFPLQRYRSNQCSNFTFR